MRRHDSKGFSLVEMAITILILGLLLGFGIPAVTGLSTSHELTGAVQNICGQLRLAREKAIATGATQTVRFISGFQGSDYHIWNGSSADPKWRLPHRVAYFWGGGTQAEYRMTKDGRCLDSGMIILQDTRGVRDTVSIQKSGLILAK